MYEAKRDGKGISERDCSGFERLRRRFSRVDVEWLSAYAPDINPVEQVWNRSKYTDLANYIPEEIAELGKEVCEPINRMRSQQTPLRSFFKKVKLKLRVVPLLMQRSINHTISAIAPHFKLFVSKVPPPATDKTI